MLSSSSYPVNTVWAKKHNSNSNNSNEKNVDENSNNNIQPSSNDPNTAADVASTTPLDVKGNDNISSSGIITPPHVKGNVSSSSSSSGVIPSAQSVFETGTITLPQGVNGFIINIPDEAHHPLTDNKAISVKNAHYIPSDLIVPSSTSIGFIHGDPNHIHSEIIKDSSNGNVVWQTTPVSHPSGSDIKILPPGKYSISDEKYPDMAGTITVQGGIKSTGNLVVGGYFTPTSMLDKFKSEFSAAGFNILSTYDFPVKTVQKDLNGPTTLIIYSTNQPMQDAMSKVAPMLGELPYK